MDGELDAIVARADHQVVVSSSGARSKLKRVAGEAAKERIGKLRHLSE
jgi:hypothetical protein